MTDKLNFSRKVESLRQVLHSYKDMNDATIIDSVANRLLSLNYTPPVHLPQELFLHMTSTEVDAEISRLSEKEVLDLEKTIQTISILVYYFKELTELRRGTAEAWDEVDELYVHD